MLNIHRRKINQPKVEVVNILRTLSTEDDLIWPKKHWPRIKFNDGMQVGAAGGHGPIRYSIEKCNLEGLVLFRFSKPLGFNGIHKFEIEAVDEYETMVTHTIDIHTEGKGTLQWLFAVKPLHNALIEDLLDNIENHFSETKKSTQWSPWVKLLRRQIKSRVEKKKIKKRNAQIA